MHRKFLQEESKTIARQKRTIIDNFKGFLKLFHNFLSFSVNRMHPAAFGFSG